MSQDQARVTSPSSGGAFGPNAWLVDDMYEQYRSRPVVGERELARVLRRLRPRRRGHRRPPRRPRAAAAAAGATVGPDGARPAGGAASTRRPAPATAPTAPATGAGADRPPTAGAVAAAGRRGADRQQHGGVARGAHRHERAARSRPSSSRPTGRCSTGTWPGPRAAKVSFTHLIGYRRRPGARRPSPRSTPAFVADIDDKGTPGVLHHDHVGPRPGGRRREVRRDADACSSR